MRHLASEDSRCRAICICVDDFGMHPGVDHAALRLAQLQRAHAIGCLVGGASWQADCRQLRRLEVSAVDIGLHLDLTEFPLLRRSRRSLVGLIAAAHAQGLDRLALRTEIRAQLQAFEDTIGATPAFIDGHRHVHQLPGVRRELLHELEGRYGRDRPWLRSTRRPRGSVDMPYRSWREQAKPWLVEALGADALSAMAARRGYAQNRHLLGVYDFQGGATRYRTLLAAWLRCATEGDLLMCHPSATWRGGDPLIDARAAEFAVLGGIEFDAALQAWGVDLRPMSRILARGAIGA